MMWWLIGTGNAYVLLMIGYNIAKYRLFYKGGGFIRFLGTVFFSNSWYFLTLFDLLRLEPAPIPKAATKYDDRGTPGPHRTPAVSGSRADPPGM